MINKITFLTVFFFTIFLVGKSFSAQIRIEAYGMDEYFSYDVGKGRQFLTYSNEGLYMTDIGVSGVIECKGIIEVINNSTSSNIMCKYTEESGDNFFAQFFVQRGTSGDATVQSFEFVSATGRWEEMLGKKCLGAYTAMQQKRFMWQGKCDISDETLERVKNYKKPE
ncbi:hypothetical protein OA264_02425 [Alphaproteobacteria bacterium]|nr:hypothetical protein [Alphaproteobacteria bacterium]